MKDKLLQQSNTTKIGLPTALLILGGIYLSNNHSIKTGEIGSVGGDVIMGTSENQKHVEAMDESFSLMLKTIIAERESTDKLIMRTRQDFLVVKSEILNLNGRVKILEDKHGGR